jgi:DNA repair exonuclease SbcCD ATPase subunit
MGKFLINTISYSGENYFYKSPQFDTGINIIEGKNGNGKSTLMNLIYYGLGGDVKSFSESSDDKHTEIVEDSNNYVELDVLIFGKRFILRRGIGNNFISVSNEAGNVETYSINRKENPEIFSDWLLDKLGISIIDIFQGNNSFKLNIKDLMRLIYHDQNPDPNKVFKKPDVESYISDSEYVRKLIFRVLLGKSFEEYYSLIGKLRKAENDKKVAESLFKEFENISAQLYSDKSEVLNVEYLHEKIEELNEQLIKLNEAREILKVSRPDESDSAWSHIENIKRKLIQVEIDTQSISEKLNNKNNELFKYERYRDGIVKEVTQLNKIIHAHETLDVFTPNSCPFCLGELDREKNKCYCGNPVDEETFEKFFFSSEEYWSLLKARKKSIETVNLVINSVIKEIEKLTIELKEFELISDELKAEVKNNLNKVDRANVDIEKLNEVDDKSLEIKNELNRLNEKLEFELKLKHYKESLDNKTKLYKGIDRDVKILELTANKEMEGIVDEFNLIYNELMTSTLKECRSARIDSESYNPLIDGGAYREASSKVSVRFNYYLTILKMALKNPKVKFPNFLLIDTPQTAGIDPEELKKLIEQFAVLPKDEYQVLLTTGHDLYPDSLKSFVKETLTDEDKLLKTK